VCLIRDEKTTARIRGSQWPLKGYNVLRWDDGRKRFRSPYIYEFDWNPGCNKSGRTSTDYDASDSLDGIQVNAGIHVYLAREDADRFRDFCCAVAEVFCQREHFVAAGHENPEALGAVFTEVVLPPEEYERLALSPELLKDLKDWEDEEDDDWGDEDEDWEEEEDKDWEDEEDDDC
jgi:hypothetical protein